MLSISANIFSYVGLNILSQDKERLEKDVERYPGLVLYKAGNDLSFIIYMLGSAILPMYYGLLGASVFLLRRHPSGNADDYVLTTSVIQTLMRLGLGSVAGIIVGGEPDRPR